MNKGLIAGQVFRWGEPAPALIFLKELTAGSRGFTGRHAFPILNARGGPIVHRIIAKSDGRFYVPFFWNAAHLGHSIGGQLKFRIFALDPEDSYKGEARGSLVTGLDPRSLWLNTAKGFISSGVLGVADFHLAKAFKTAFTPKIPAEHLIAVGAAAITLEP